MVDTDKILDREKSAKIPLDDMIKTAEAKAAEQNKNCVVRPAPPDVRERGELHH